MLLRTAGDSFPVTPGSKSVETKDSTIPLDIEIGIAINISARALMSRLLILLGVGHPGKVAFRGLAGEGSVWLGTRGVTCSR